MKDKKFLMIPVYFLLILFIVDKVFALDYFKTKFIQPGNAIFYHHRNVLAERIKKDPIVRDHSKKLAIALGDSRAYPFSQPGLPDREKSNWIIYNFASPQAVPMYSLLRYERLIEAGIIPDLIYLAVSPEAFDDSKGMIYDPFMRLGMDDKFIQDHWELIPWKDRYKYWIGKAFAFKNLQLDYKALIDRFKTKRMREFNPDFNEDMMVLNIGKGEYLGYATLANNEKKLKKDSARIKNIYLNDYQFSNTQMVFIEKLLKLADEKGTKVFLVWPRVYIDYRNSYLEMNFYEIWWSKIQSLAKKYNAIDVDFNKESSCDFFNDASHQSIQCFIEQMDTIFQKYEESK